MSETVWNHNLHYLPELLRALPERRSRALDVGCGEGIVARRLRPCFEHVTGIDTDAAMVALARELDEEATGADYVVGDVLTFPFERASFDLVVCVAALHHMDAAAGLARMSELLAPGGRLAVLGLARSRYPVDIPRDLAAVLVDRLHALGRDRWHTPARKLWPPPQTHAQVHAQAQRILPGSRYRRHLLWRYSIQWTKPPGEPPATLTT